MLQMRALPLMLLLGLLTRYQVIAEGAEGVTPTTSGTSEPQYKDFTFTMEFKNGQSKGETLDNLRSKMVDVEKFVRETLLTQNGEININTEIIPHDVTSTASITTGIPTITSSVPDPTWPTSIETDIAGTSTITSSDTTWPTSIATSIAQQTITTPGCPQTNLIFSRNGEVEDYVLYNGSTVPQLINVSVCTLLTPPTGKVIGRGTVLSYYKYGSLYGNTMLIYFQSNKRLYIATHGYQTTDFVLDQTVRDRTHFCFLISTAERKAEIFRNGISLGHKHLPCNAAVPEGGALVIGHDQDPASDEDTFLGQMKDPVDTFTGTIENLYIWSRILREDEIDKLNNSRCACPRGHVIALSDANVETHGQAHVSSLRNDCN